MSNWVKKDISKEVVKEIHDRYGCDTLTASIFARRGILEGKDILYFMEDDKRYLHNPFLFNTMEDAVDRILQARDEGEKVLIFGDRDVDGITSTTLLYTYLEQLGMDVRWRLPVGNDTYGLSIVAIDEFAAEYGSLIITVDCGISNTNEVAHAATLGIDVIIADHHNPPASIPSPAIILNPKMEACGYPFTEISGCAVVYKLVSALRFSYSELYKQELCLLNVRPVNEAFVIEGIKTVNLIERDRILETIVPGMLSIAETRLPDFLQGQQILCWDEPLQVKQLEKIFGTGVEFNMLDIRPEISRLIPSLADMSLLRLKSRSKIALYKDTPADELDSFLNLFITFSGKQVLGQGSDEQDALDLQLVTLAAMADSMPLKNENRILVRQGLASMQGGKLRNGLLEIFTRLGLLGKRIGSTELSWNVVPVLNAAGRLGQPELAVQLLTAKEQSERDILAQKIVALNEERKQLGSDALGIAEKHVWDNFERFNKKLAVVADGRIHRGVTGILATRLAKTFKVPAFVITFFDDGTAVGSVRSSCGFEVIGLLDSCSDLFSNYGGHNFAAGFGFKKDKLEELLQRLASLAAFMDLEVDTGDEDIIIDAELPHSFMTPDIMELVGRFEPYGQGNPPLVFVSRKLKIVDATIMGKTERMHLKLTFDCGKHKWPAIFWGESERLKRDFDIGDFVDATFRIEQNNFNGSASLQLILQDCIKLK